MPVLFDQLLRHQIYLEGLKSHEMNRINKRLMADLEKIIAKELKSLKIKRFDALTAVGRDRVIARIAKQHRKLLARWRADLQASMRAYAKADAAMMAKVFGDHKRARKPSIASLWADIANNSVAGTDGNVKDMIDKMGATQLKAIRGAFKTAYAEGKSVDELYSSIRGTKENGYKDGVLRKIRNDGRAVGATAFQHVKGQVHEAVASTTFDRYRWVSVIDSATSKICRGRNGKIYEYGKGPVPPAHYHCRSSTVPVDDEIEEPQDKDPPFFDWVQTQPEEFIRDIFSKSDAEKLIRGTARREDFERFEGIGSLTLDEFIEKVSIIRL